MIQGHYLVRGNVDDHKHHHHIIPNDGGHPNVEQFDPTEDNESIYRPMLISDTSISFWGGIDPTTGMIIDTLHPLYGTCITNQILCIPSSRGSCTTSQVLLELILNGTVPHTIIVRDANDALLCIGAIIAQEFFPDVSQVCHIVCIGTEGYQQLLHISKTDTSSYSTTLQHTSVQQLSPQQRLLQGHVTSNGQLHIRTTDGTILTSSTHTETTSTLLETETTSNNSNNNISFSLSDEEQTYLDQCTTDAERMALKVIYRYAKLSSVSSTSSVTTNSTPQPHTKRQYIPIQQSHIDGCTYIGPGGLKFVQQLQNAGGTVKVPTTLNAVSTDRRYWSKYQIPMEYAHNAIALGDAYIALGCQPTFTCAPYLLLQPSSSPPPAAGTAPSIVTTTTNGSTNYICDSPTSVLFGQDIAWGESNAVVYANSVLGARTEKYADYLDICCAITGIVPQLGVHQTENRIPTVRIDGTATFQIIQSFIDHHQNSDTASSTILDLDVLFPILGHLCGRLSDGRVPILTGFDTTDASYWNTMITTDHLKSFCAAFGTTASSPLIHIAGITPEAKDPTTIQTFVSSCDTQRTIALLDIYETFHKFNTTTSINLDGAESESIDLVALGNPHLSSSECADLARTIQQVCLPTTIRSPDLSLSKAQSRIIACISREIYAQTNPEDLRIMHEFGIEFIYDTCWCMLLDEPIIPHNPLGIIMTNSGKYAHYGPGLTNRRFRFGSMYDCIYAARYGYSPIRVLPNATSNANDMNILSDPTSSEAPPSSSTSLPKSNVAMNRFDPYLSFLIRPSTSKNYLQNQSIRSYSSMASSFLRGSRTLHHHVPKPKQRMLATKLPSPPLPIAKRNVIYTLSLLMKQCCR